MPASSSAPRLDLFTPRGFHTHGKEFFVAAEAVHASPRYPVLPLVFLWGRTIELLLKSYLLSVGISIERLRSREFGHNLVALHKEANAQGLVTLVGTDQSIAGLIELLNIEYGRKRLEYRESGTMYQVPDGELARRIIRRLLKGIDFHLRERGI
jgi:hypothetical protein